MRGAFPESRDRLNVVIQLTLDAAYCRIGGDTDEVAVLKVDAGASL